MAVVIIGIAIINPTSCAQEHCRTYRVAGGSGRRRGRKRNLVGEKGAENSRNGRERKLGGDGSTLETGGNLEQRTFTPTRPVDWAMA